MKRMLLVLATAVVLLNTLVIPTLAHADGEPKGSNCSGQTACKP